MTLENKSQLCLVLGSLLAVFQGHFDSDSPCWGLACTNNFYDNRCPILVYPLLTFCKSSSYKASKASCLSCYVEAWKCLKVWYIQGPARWSSVFHSGTSLALSSICGSSAIIKSLVIENCINTCWKEADTTMYKLRAVKHKNTHVVNNVLCYVSIIW